jgi:hypothetical protein
MPQQNQQLPATVTSTQKLQLMLSLHTQQEGSMVYILMTANSNGRAYLAGLAGPKVGEQGLSKVCAHMACFCSLRLIFNVPKRF